MKKVLSLVLALLMTASTASAVLADDVVAIAEEPVAVEEVAEEVEAGQYDKAIEFLANYGIFKGYNADDTGAEDLIQRYQMALFVGRIATGWVDDEQWEDGPENWSEFNDIDVDPVNKYYGALSFANQKGIIEGYGNGKFGPTDSIKYQDALTMVVRTLGYTGLDWPWGYIQKAVELGLTDGITGVAYTDELTRGEVAQIIYNALFADMKDGSNLALKNFGIEFGWEKVVITASNINTFEKLANDKGTKVEKELVEFKLLNNDGTLADDSYKALAADFDLDYTKHEDDLAVGDAYYVLFEKDADSALVEIVAVESLLVDVIENEGKTDDEGEEQEYAIQEFLADYTLVDKYTTDNYLNITASLKPELLVWDVVGGITEDVVDGYAIAIDWNTGDILGFDYKDGKAVDQNGDEKLDKEDYKVQWYFNALLGRYYEEQYDKKTGELLGINYMTDEEFEEFYESTVIKAKKNYKGFTAITSIAKTAYATLEVFDTNLDGVADRALYESYKLGYFSNSTVKCCDKDRASYKISGVNTLAKAAAYNGNDKEALDVAAINTLVEGVCDHGKAWFVEGYTPVVAYDEDGEEAGYEAGYVIYSYDDETGAIKVVKNIDDGSDEDSYVATGVVRAYNVNKETITIGEEKLTMNYDELAGTGFYLVDKNAATKAAYTATLRDLFNQFVTYVVVDGELVHIEAAGREKDEVIVVESYAGLSSDGYIVVNGYSTDDLEYAQFRLGSVDGWKEGDFYYYIKNYGNESAIVRGMILTISSYDEEEDLYYVNYAGGFRDYYIAIENDNGELDREYYGTLYEVEAGVDMAQTKLVAADDGYMTKYSEYDEDDGYTKTEYVKMSSSDKYVIISFIPDNRYATVRVYEGKLPENTTIEGDLIKAADGTYVFVNVTTCTLRDNFETGLVVLLDDTYYSASYNGEDAEDWYLLGAVEYEVNVFDLLSGKFDVTKYATNKNYVEGYAYWTQGDVLTREGGWYFDAAYQIVNAVNFAYPDKDTYFAAEIEDLLDNTALYNTKDGANKKAIEEMLLDDMGSIKGSTKYRGDKVDGVTYRVIEIAEDKTIDINDSVVGDDDAAKLLKYADKNDYSEIPAFYIYNVEDETIVIYLVASEVEVTTVDDDAECEVLLATSMDAEKEDAKLVATVKYEETTTDDLVVSHKITGLDIEFVVEDEDARHQLIANKKWFLGRKGADNNEGYKVVYSLTDANNASADDKVAIAEEILGTIVAEEYSYSDCDECAECTLVKKLSLAFADTITVDIIYDEDGKIINADDIVIGIDIDGLNGDDFQLSLIDTVKDNKIVYVLDTVTLWSGAELQVAAK